MIFVVVYNLENRNPPETENESARKPGVRWCRQGTNQNNSKLCFHRKKPSSELCLKISYRWLLDFCWFFVCTKVSQLLLLFEVVIRSKREYKVVHCVNLTIFFFWWWLKTFWFFSNCRLIVIGGDGGVWRRRIIAAIDCFLVNVFFLIFCSL